MSIISIILLNSAALFGMKSRYNGALAVMLDKKSVNSTSFDALVSRLNNNQLLLKNEPENKLPGKEYFRPLIKDKAYYQPQANLPLERIVDIAATDNEAKNKIGLSCKFFNEILSKKENSILSLMTNPLFNATAKDLVEIRMSALWNGLENKNKIVGLVNDWIGSEVFFDMLNLEEDIPKLKNLCRRDQIDVFVEEKFLKISRDLNVGIGELSNFKKTYRYDLLLNVLRSAALCSDPVAMKVLSLKIKDALNSMSKYDEREDMQRYIDLLKFLVCFDKQMSFEFILKQNIDHIFNFKYKIEEYEDPTVLLFVSDCLIELDSQYLQDKYFGIYNNYKDNYKNKDKDPQDLKDTYVVYLNESIKTVDESKKEEQSKIGCVIF